MTTHRRLALSALLACAALSSGCVLSAPHLDPVRHDMEARLPGLRLEPQAQIHLGRLSLGMAKGIARMAMEEDDEQETFAVLRHVKRVEVAVYETAPLHGDEVARWRQYVDDLGRRRGWVPFATLREGDSGSAVFFKMKRGEIRGVYLFTLDDESLVMARFLGPLEQAVAEALALDGDRITDELTHGEAGDSRHRAPDEETPGVAASAAAGR